MFEIIKKIDTAITNKFHFWSKIPFVGKLVIAIFAVSILNSTFGYWMPMVVAGLVIYVVSKKIK